MDDLLKLIRAKPRLIPARLYNFRSGFRFFFFSKGCGDIRADNVNATNLYEAT